MSVRISNMIENVYRNSTGGDIRMSDEFSEAFYALHDYLYRTVYKGSAAKAEESKAEDMIEILFHYLCNHPDRIPDEYRPVMRETGKRGGNSARADGAAAARRRGNQPYEYPTQNASPGFP